MKPCHTLRPVDFSDNSRIGTPLCDGEAGSFRPSLAFVHNENEQRSTRRRLTVDFKEPAKHRSPHLLIRDTLLVRDTLSQENVENEHRYRRGDVPDASNCVAGGRVAADFLIDTHGRKNRTRTFIGGVAASVSKTFER